MQTIDSPVESQLSRDLNPRKVFAQFATGVCILLTESSSENACMGLTVNSFSSLSLEPLLVTFALKSSCRYLQNFNAKKIFSINMLSHQQKSLCKECSIAGGKLIELNVLKKRNFYYIPDSLATIGCLVWQMLDAGDHVLFICEVTDLFILKENEPLIFYDSKFFTSLS